MSKTEISVPGEECMNTLNVEGELLEESSNCIYAAVKDEKAMSKSEISVPLKIQNIVCSMQLDTLCALLFSTIEFL